VWSRLRRSSTILQNRQQEIGLARERKNNYVETFG
jgi:hypothetical protein